MAEKEAVQILPPKDGQVYRVPMGDEGEVILMTFGRHTGSAEVVRRRGAEYGLVLANEVVLQALLHSHPDLNREMSTLIFEVVALSGFDHFNSEALPCASWVETIVTKEEKRNECGLVMINSSQFKDGFTANYWFAFVEHLPQV